MRVRATNGLAPYTLRNQLLIAADCAERGIVPTYVAGFRAFLALNRCVRKGERAIQILAPMAVTDRADTRDGDQPDAHNGEERRRVFFRTVPVFDTLSRAPPGVRVQSHGGGVPGHLDSRRPRDSAPSASSA